MKWLFPCFAAAAVAVACSSCSESSDSAPGVGILKSGDYELVLHSAPDGPRYSLRNDEGKIIADELTRNELAKAYPSIHEELDSLWAGNETPLPAELSPSSPRLSPGMEGSRTLVPVETALPEIPAIDR